jgi:hypothetical protein
MPRQLHDQIAVIAGIPPGIARETATQFGTRGASFAYGSGGRKSGTSPTVQAVTALSALLEHYLPPRLRSETRGSKDLHREERNTHDHQERWRYG